MQRKIGTLHKGTTTHELMFLLLSGTTVGLNNILEERFQAF